jgi:hypothetical protein
LDDYARTVRTDLGLDPGQYLILQPTRIIQRKGIEHAIELTRRLGLPAALVISHAAGDEGTDYEQRVREFAALLDVRINFESAIVGEARGLSPDGRKIYTLGTTHRHLDVSLHRGLAMLPQRSTTNDLVLSATRCKKQTSNRKA